ncbi:hypothetical protein [Ureibacillus acetophenoni]|uniref:Uncharacterized protein n=1 Tax=Ureibacillus acetophenoni TaxID=614649 RepID=A0A285UDC6_9BACL|nr:hypothetical protein [Ureibacillus acetophenoni]SOC39832.1 hypothetical protein SAMN05877842_106142 [Ureibacillus acetophenoni]
MTKKYRAQLGLFGSLLLCFSGVYRLIMEYPVIEFIPALFAVSGFIGILGGIFEIRKINKKENNDKLLENN